MLRDLKPTDNVGGFDVRPGNFLLNGATTVSGGVNFTIHSVYAVECTLLLFRPYAKIPYARLRFPDSYKIGNTYSMLVFGLDEIDFEYAYSFDGPYEPEKGIIFDKKKYILDPYAKAVIGQSGWGKKQEHEGVYKARVVNSDYDWGNCTQPKLPFEELIIYEMHVRGFTQDGSSGVKNKGTFAGIREKIPYLKELGINAVEMMPIFEFDEMGSYRNYDGRQLYDYWGYNTVCFFAPNTSYESDHEHHHEGRELKQLVRELHENGIEVILDVVFNHTAEGNEMGPYFSFKGIDNNIYYMLTPDGKYYNFSGCGNVLNCNQPIVQQFILDCLRYWVTEYRIDGFRFDLASILGRNEDGTPMDKPPLLKSLAFDPILGGVKLIAEAWDAGGLYQVGSFPSWNRWAEWNGRYRDDLRRFLKGDNHLAWDAAQRITKAAVRHHLKTAEEQLHLRDEEQEPAYTPPRPIAVDDQVELPGVKMAATVLAVNGDGTLLLQAGHMKMTVKAQQVRLLEGAPKKSKPAPSPSAATLNTVSRASSELDIRGYETLEAESVVENYLDSAVMAKLGTVTIIHGKGTGALRKAVHEILRRNKAVKSFRLGRYGEGEAGVTVVELK